MHRLVLLAVLALAAVVVVACGGSDDAGAPVDRERLISDAGPQHVHGLGVNPADGALYIATHSGLWRAPAGQSRPSASPTTTTT